MYKIIQYNMHGVLKDLTRLLSSLPGIGPRSARRIAITLAQQKEDTAMILVELLNQMKNTIRKCKMCNNLCQESICYICHNRNRDQNQICIVSEVADLWAIENMGQYDGVYYVLGGTLSIANAIGPDNLDFETLEYRLTMDMEAKECIIAMNPTIQGQATVHYIHEILKKYDHITISTLALGLPMGAQLDYLDNSTLAMALLSRKEI